MKTTSATANNPFVLLLRRALSALNPSGALKLKSARLWHPVYVFLVLILFSPAGASFLMVQNSTAGERADVYTAFSFLRQCSAYMMFAVIACFSLMAAYRYIPLPSFFGTAVLLASDAFWLFWNRRQIAAMLKKRADAPTPRAGGPANTCCPSCT
ncbi:hypothetical protein [Neisseria elongata]|uniref:hypothetical protein n=1 Tax=Neisseria elongata TaxID=495 RepID=UPI0028E4CE90|nr:hypothetical protein [Neisseria elongata]